MTSGENRALPRRAAVREHGLELRLQRSGARRVGCVDRSRAVGEGVRAGAAPKSRTIPKDEAMAAIIVEAAKRLRLRFMLLRRETALLSSGVGV